MPHLQVPFLGPQLLSLSSRAWKPKLLSPSALEPCESVCRDDCWLASREMWVSPQGLLPPSLAPVGASPWWKAPGARYTPHLPMLGLYLLFRSALPPCLVLWGVALSRWGELNLHCVLFSPPAPYIYSYSCASPKSELSHPQSYSTAPVRMASEAPEKGSGCAE